jgi:hypothetical protein
VSSPGFAADLVPTSLLRRLLLAASAGATLTGTVLILGLPLLPVFKGAFVGLWLCSGFCELRMQLRGTSRVCRIRIDPDGRLQGRSPAGGTEPLQLLSGSFVLARVAWLRLQFLDGVRYGELLTGNAQARRDWHRLQLIWRQRASIFGRPRVS